MKESPAPWADKLVVPYLYPAWKRWPGLESYWGVFRHPLMCEFTVQDQMAGNAVRMGVPGGAAVGSNWYSGDTILISLSIPYAVPGIYDKYVMDVIELRFGPYETVESKLDSFPIQPDIKVNELESLAEKVYGLILERAMSYKPPPETESVTIDPKTGEILEIIYKETPTAKER